MGEMGGEEGGEEPNKKSKSSINHSILSGLNVFFLTT
jgi:hypothetical protein